MNIDDLGLSNWSISVGCGDPLSFEGVLSIDTSVPHWRFTNATSITEFPMKPVRCVLNDPATILFWPDGTKTVVKCQEGDVWDPEKGIALAMLKKYFGGSGKYNDIIRDLIPEEK